MRTMLKRELLLILVFISIATQSYGGYGIVPNKGTINGMYLTYYSSSEIVITHGFCEANGKYYEFDSDVNYSLSHFTEGGYTYIYIDDSEGSSPSIEFTDSSSAPGYDETKNGWYNGSDRCIGALYCDSNSSILAFVTHETTIKWVVGQGEYGIPLNYMYTNKMTGNGSWVAPNQYESSQKLPVTADGAIVQIVTSDTADMTCVYAAAYEKVINSPHQFLSDLSDCGYQVSLTTGMIDLYSSRNIRLSSQSDDDYIYCWLNGYRYVR